MAKAMFSYTVMVGIRPEILKDNAHLTAQIRHLMAVQAGNILAQHGHLALTGQLFAQQQLEQGGFACAGMAQQEHELAVVHMEIDIVQCQRSAPVYIPWKRVLNRS